MARESTGICRFCDVLLGWFLKQGAVQYRAVLTRGTAAVLRVLSGTEFSWEAVKVYLNKLLYKRL